VRQVVFWAAVAWLSVVLPSYGVDDSTWFSQLTPPGPAAGASPVAQSADNGLYPECQGFGPCLQCCRVWTVDAGAVVLQRSKPGSRTLLMDAAPPTGAEVLNARDFHFGTEAGPALTLRRHFDVCSVEMRYFGVDDWSRSVGPLSTSPGIYVPFPTPYVDTDGAYQITSGYESDLHSLELNFTRPLDDRWGFIIGYRYLDLKESLGAHMIDVDVGGTTITDVGLATKNRLHGFQLGVGGEIWNVGGRFSLEGTLKAGVYDNLMRGNAWIDQELGTSWASAARTHHAAFLGELELAARYQITRRLSVRAGYQVTWIEGVALAADQMSTIDPGFAAAMNTAGSPMYHGLNASLQYTW